MVLQYFLMKFIASFQKSFFSSRGIRRFRGLLIAPLFLFAMCGNYYFLVGEKIGQLCLKIAVTSWPFGTPILLLIMYCGSQFGIEVKNWEISQKMLSIKTQ